MREISRQGVQGPLYTPLDNLSGLENPFEASFRLPNGLEPSPNRLSELFLSDSLIREIVFASNQYARKILPRSQVEVVTEEEILRFLAVYYYMGVVTLPSKDDYWRTETDFWPVHPVVAPLAYNQCKYIWRTIHLTHDDEVDVEDPVIEGMEDEEEEDEFHHRVTPPPEDCDEVRDVDNRWYMKAAPVVEHFVEVSQRLCEHLGYALSVDEMMKLFKGRSKQTHRMKNKPIKEGYKFFALCDATCGYIWNIIPDGRLEKTTIHDTVMELVNSLPKKETWKYSVGMDNYFTFAKVLKSMRDVGVGCVGTARARRGWPPKEFKDITDDRFNTWYLLKEEHQLTCRWVDNNIVTMVSTVHNGYEKIKKTRRRPRPTATNRRHVQAVWGNNGTAEIEIPGVIDDYNHWMGGVDKADQLIAYYRPPLRCRRTWMPLFFHVLDCMRVNGFIIMKKHDKTTKHKEFTKEWIKALNARAHAASLSVRRAARHRQDDEAPPIIHPFKRRRMSHSRPTLPEYRFNGNPLDHQHTTDPKLTGPKATPCTCAYCAYEAAMAKLLGTDPPVPKKTVKMCSYCLDYLCKHHFDDFHAKEVEMDELVEPV